MLFATASTLSSENATYSQEHFRVLRGILNEQQVDLEALRTIIEHIDSSNSAILMQQEEENYTAQLLHIEDDQKERFKKIDEMIYQNRKEIKKGKITDHKIERYGKEVRKLEAGLRTLRLFAGDVIAMQSPKSVVINRADDRIAYFKKRSTALMAEIHELMENIVLLSSSEG